MEKTQIPGYTMFELYLLSESGIKNVSLIKLLTMITTTELVIATRNAGKFREFSYLLKDHFSRICSLDEFGPLPQIEETGETFCENAYLKASGIAELIKKPTLADDSGLVVDALNGEPGVYSARYAGDEATDDENIERLLQNMGDSSNRTARFVCCLSLIIPGSVSIEAEGSCEGEILRKRKGKGGFGYDPVFHIPEINKTMAELTAREKNSISHRYRALDNLIKKINLY